MSKYIKISDWQPIDVDDLEPNAFKVVKSNKNQYVIAGPGAGKTELLAQRACFLLQTGMCPSPKKILAISFKKDSAKNLKNRVAERCKNEDAVRFDSLTFDAFSKSLLDRFLSALPEHWRPSNDYQLLFPTHRTFDNFIEQLARSQTDMQLQQEIDRDSGY
ncbi:DNA helicase N-terminal domain-containing protein, UvrD/REP-like [Desulfonema limicola]|uniref:DNA helicase N-terminal domain-containing protein, UvrD/REP-like n=1 Tax=Desulfonema limicola TaxID=45656 RepID=A0A975B4P8_9BACT|nr:UvrD-helicase domain-containing protein [Desulfonema limicola]QTA78727.1 DNA helicase N-terminal domain-containing protein, UvrD/REP-like [Desulfonema limicola]